MASKYKHYPVRGGAGQFADNRPAALQLKKLRDGITDSPRDQETAQLREAMQDGSVDQAAPIQRKSNQTGLPDNLKSGIENLGGFAMDDVKVHYNSSKPAQLQAHAYAQGSNIHLAPGQEKHLPHEAWHVVQQKQGRVQPTRQLKSKVSINDDAGLEKEADVMGAKALQMKPEENVLSGTKENTSSSAAQLTVQRVPLLPALPAPAGIAAPATLAGLYNAAELAVTPPAAGALDPVAAVNALKVLLRELEFWRHNQGTNANWTALHGAGWETLYNDVYDRILAHSDARTVGAGGALNVVSPTDLINKMEGALQALAMRTTVGNVGVFAGTNMATMRQNRRDQQEGWISQNIGAAPGNLGGMSPFGLRRTRRRLETNRSGVCNEFAQGAASLLTGKGQRVEVLGSTAGKHNFVVVGRQTVSDVDDYTTWGPNARVVDLWLGALEWTILAGDTKPVRNYPQIVFLPANHQDEFEADNSYYDSDQPVVRGASPILGAALAGLNTFTGPG